MTAKPLSASSNDYWSHIVMNPGR